MVSFASSETEAALLKDPPSGLLHLHPVGKKGEFPISDLLTSAFLLSKGKAFFHRKRTLATQATHWLSGDGTCLGNVCMVLRETVGGDWTHLQAPLLDSMCP